MLKFEYGSRTNGSSVKKDNRPQDKIFLKLRRISKSGHTDGDNDDGDDDDDDDGDIDTEGWGMSMNPSI